MQQNKKQENALHVNKHLLDQIGLHTLRSKVSFMVIIALIVLASFASIVVWQNQHTTKISQRLVNTREPALNAAKNILLGLGQVTQTAQLFILTKARNGDLIAQHNQHWENQIFPALVQLDRLQIHLSEKASQQAIDSLNLLLPRYKMFSDSTLNLYEEGLALAKVRLDTIKNAEARSFAFLKVEGLLLRQIGGISVKYTSPLNSKIKRQLDTIVKEQTAKIRRDYLDLKKQNQWVNTTAILMAFGAGGLLLLLGFVLVNRLRNSVQKSVRTLSRLAKGHLLDNQLVEHNEFGELTQAANQLAHNLQEASIFARNVGEGDFESAFKAASEGDILGNALIDMRQRLRQVAEEDKQRNWANEGYAKFGDLLRRYSNDLGNLGDILLQELINYLQANQGGFFVYQEEADAKYLELRAAFAYNRKKFLRRKVKIFEDYAEDLIGQCFLEQQSIYLREIPEDYIQVTSGLGDAPPRNLIIVPLNTNETTEGVLEIASFREFLPHEIAFIENISENIASSINIARINERTRQLLENSQMQRETMRAQEEEMRQNMEELQSTQEEMQRIQRELQENEANLRALINSTDDSLLTVDRQYRAVIINDVLKARYKGTSYEGIKEGVNVLNFLGDVQQEWQDYYDRALAGEKFDLIKESTVEGESSFRHYFFTPIRNIQNEVIALSVFSRDITEQKNREIRQKAQIQKLQQQNQLFGQIIAFAEFVENGEILLSNSRFGELLNGDEANGKTANIYDIFTKNEIKEALKDIQLQKALAKNLTDQKGHTWRGFLQSTNESEQNHYLLALC